MLNKISSIKNNILQNGFHTEMIRSTTSPRCTYTIGLANQIGFELVFAGGAYFLLDDVNFIFKRISSKLLTKENSILDLLNLGQLGSFELKEIDVSWVQLLMGNALNYYNTDQVRFIQIVPVGDKFTNDIPNMSIPFSVITEPIWRFLKDPWNYKIPQNSQIVTDIDSLRGKPILEAMRWEEDYWEMFSNNGNIFDKESCRVVPIQTILGMDPSLYDIINIEVGKGIWRESNEDKWENWKPRK